MTDIKQLFNDIAREMNGKCVEDTFTIKGHAYKMRLLNGEEANWRNMFIIVRSQISALSSLKLPTLAMGIREVDGKPVTEAFKEDWDSLSATERMEYERANKYAKKYFIAERFMEFLAKWPDYELDELWKHWAILEDRREDVQVELKKSSGEGSEKAESESSTIPSPSGEV